jgi:uncharacterized protein (DUF302 family)
VNQFSDENHPAEGGSDPLDKRLNRRSILKAGIAAGAAIAAGAGAAAPLLGNGQSEQNQSRRVNMSELLFHDQSSLASQGGHPMNVTRITVEHVRVVAEKPFDQATKAFEQQLGQFNPDVYKSLIAGEDAERVRAKLEAMVGPSGFMLFRTSDHGSLLRLVGQKKKAIQYLIGNPLFAIQMTQHDIRAGLYAPLRVLLYENEHGKTCVEYDRPSTLFGQFGNANVRDVATMLDRKLEQLVAKAIQ